MYGFILRSLTFETAEILKRPHVTSLSVSGGLVLLWVWLVSLLSPLPVWPHPLSPQVPENTHSHAHNTAVVFSNTHIWIITFIQVDYLFTDSASPSLSNHPPCCPPTPATTNQSATISLLPGNNQSTPGMTTITRHIRHFDSHQSSYKQMTCEHFAWSFYMNYRSRPTFNALIMPCYATYNALYDDIMDNYHRL